MLREEEQELLFGLVMGFDPVHIVEVGSYHGVSAITMAFALQHCDRHILTAFGRILSFDVDETRVATARKNAETFGVADMIRFEHRSSQMLTETDMPTDIGLFFVDGDHHRDAARADIKFATSVCRRVLVHDAVHDPEVHEVCEEFGQRPDLTLTYLRRENAGFALLTSRGPLARYQRKGNT